MQNFSELIKSEKPTLVDFSAEWCGPCKMMAPILNQLEGMVKGKANIVTIDVDDDNELATQYRIQSVPTLIVFKNGEIKWQQSGVVPADYLKNIIEQFV